MKKRIYYRIFCAIAVFMVLKSGRMIYHKKVDNINITKEGPARESRQNVARIKAYIEAFRSLLTAGQKSFTKLIFGWKSFHTDNTGL